MSLEKKQFWDTQSNWEFLAYTPKQITQAGTDSFLKLVENDLKNLGFNCVKLSEEEIWRRIKQKVIYDFSETATQFIGRCRKLFFTPDELQKKIEQYNAKASSDIEKKFLQILKIEVKLTSILS